MCSSLMSSFDPSTSIILGLKVKWFIILFPFFFMTGSYYLIHSGYRFYMSFVLNNLLMSHYMSIISLSVFMMILAFNTISLMPLVLPCTSHLSVNLGLCLPLWMSGVVYSLKSSMRGFLAHLLPYGSPTMLSPFLVVIELLSVSIRPVSLSVRLLANITGGHLIMNLLEEGLSSAVLLVLPFSMAAYVLLLAAELFVSFIQSYVLSKLVSIYWEECR
uniref:ATP synthase subunit a n=1 Tax=Pediculus humanus subsp. corporis TaxID=121224 RepID=X2D1W3_PEDHC|nr:ATP synthase F0 subunit 6 [Pediculus humanus corporis]AHF70463.1 ATP synthase F0 subunit 6 [Pediculus humanus corporis]AHF70465.1 ATP synthase F0 subunit 6 [Pediculus humanus corporis]